MFWLLYYPDVATSFTDLWAYDANDPGREDDVAPGRLESLTGRSTIVVRLLNPQNLKSESLRIGKVRPWQTTTWPGECWELLGMWLATCERCLGQFPILILGNSISVFTNSGVAPAAFQICFPQEEICLRVSTKLNCFALFWESASTDIDNVWR